MKLLLIKKCFHIENKSMEADMENGIFSQNTPEETGSSLPQQDFLNSDLKAMLAQYLTGCTDIYDEIELKGRLIDYIRKM